MKLIHMPKSNYVHIVAAIGKCEVAIHLFFYLKIKQINGNSGDQTIERNETKKETLKNKHIERIRKKRETICFAAQMYLCSINNC